MGTELRPRVRRTGREKADLPPKPDPKAGTDTRTAGTDTRTKAKSRAGTGARSTASATRRKPRPGPGDAHERELAELGHCRVVGLDEVGRGAWAGPVTVGVVVHPFDRIAPIGIRDSKELNEPQREALYPQVAEWCTEWSVGHAGPEECDALGMTRALRLAAQRALTGLSAAPDVVLLDGSFDYLSDPDARAPEPAVRTVVRGDSTCLSVAAASILAKVTRDRMMRSWAECFPPFDFDRNKGYPSPSHRTALAGHGLSSIHRRSWSFVGDLAFR